MTSGRGPHWRPKSYHTAIIVVVVVGIHGETRRYRLCASFASGPRPVIQVIRSRIENDTRPFGVVYYESRAAAARPRRCGKAGPCGAAIVSRRFCGGRKGNLKRLGHKVSFICAQP
jgi:hypothetical protein